MAVYSLLHFPSGYPAWPLASTLPGGARTFLPNNVGAITQPTYQLHFSLALTERTVKEYSLGILPLSFWLLVFAEDKLGEESKP